jgi:hypothetical protein
MNPVTIDPEDGRVVDWLADRFGATAYGIRTTLSLLDDLSASPEEPQLTGAIVVDANQTTWTAVAARKQRWRGDFCGEQRAADWLNLHHPVLLVFEGYLGDTPKAES